MKIAYYADTDSLYIDLADRPSARTQEVAAGVHLDYDQDGVLVGVDIDLASKRLDLSMVELDHLPSGTKILSPSA